jgi:hypothetical protein
MFFSIGSQAKENFSEHYQLGPFAVSTDLGWQQHRSHNHTAVYKGYADSDYLVNVLDYVVQQPEPQLFGNFCVIVYDHELEQLRIQTDRWRSFPIYIADREVTNLVPSSTVAWTDSLVSIDHNFEITETKFDPIGPIDTRPVSVEQVTDFIHHRLTEKTQNFLRFNNLPVRAFLSGGVDSLLVYSYLQRFSQDIELVRGNIIEYDRFWLKNSGDIGRHWAYQQIHHWREPCVLTSGAPGDEFMLRSPTTTDLFLKYHGIHITDLLQQQTWLHTDYFAQPKHAELFQTQTVNSSWSETQLHWNLCNMVINDWQHWHLGNTLTWTPLRDLEIFKALLRLPADSAVGQIMNSNISLQLIERNCTGLTRLISDQKNTGNMMSNLSDFLLQSS